MENKMTLFVGTYTQALPWVNGTCGDGIYTYSFDMKSGELRPKAEAVKIDNPSFLTISPDKQYLYAVSEMQDVVAGRISAYKIDELTQDLSLINKQPSLGSSTAYTAMDASQRYVLLANYNGPKAVVMLPVTPTGFLEPASCSIEHTQLPKGTVPARQDTAHAHCIIPDPTNQFAMVCDLGLDKIFVYRLDLVNGQLILQHEVQMADGSGPRHLAFHPNGKFAYVIEELASCITLLSYDSQQGDLQLVETVSALPDDFAEHNQSADIHITPNGRFLYASNRGHDSLATYTINQESGQLACVGHQSTHGIAPRNFVIDPSGNYLLVGNQDSDNIVVFRINQQSGELVETGQSIQCPMPVCLQFLA